MAILFLIITIPIACFGAYWCVDFLIWKYQAEIVEAEVIDFQTKKNKGRVLPVMRLFRDANKIETMNVKRIDALACLMLPLQKNEVRDVWVRGKDVIVPGYVQVVTGAVMVMPFFIALGSVMGNSQFMVQASYLFVLVGIIVLSFVGMILIRRT